MNRCEKVLQDKVLKIKAFQDKTVTVTEDMVEKFAHLCGDFNPVHFSDQEAQKAKFKQRIAHGMLSASFISAVLGNSEVGRGGIYLKQNLEFLRPVYIGDEVTVKAEIVDLNYQQNTAVIKTNVLNSIGKVVVRGEATVWAPNFISQGPFQLV